MRFQSVNHVNSGFVGEHPNLLARTEGKVARESLRNCKSKNADRRMVSEGNGLVWGDWGKRVMTTGCALVGTRVS
jgi:hypothetical protein